MPSRVPRRNTRAITATIAALKASGRYEAVDEGLAMMAVSVAERFDRALADPATKLYAVAAIGRLHLSVTLALLGRFAEEPETSGVDEIVAFLQSAPESLRPPPDDQITSEQW